MKKLLSLTIAIILLSSATIALAGDKNWGLGFGKDGTLPSGHASAEYLSQYSAYYHGDTNEKILYLTFDAGYENGYTADILDILAKHEVPAAFFLVGHYFESAPELVKRMHEEGHIVGNHSNNHPNMCNLSREQFAQELEQANDLFHTITGEEMTKIYRPPSGTYCESNLKWAQELGYTTAFWSLAYADWDNKNQPSHETAFNKLLPRTHNGAIILLHNTSHTNAEVLDELITRWKADGYRFASLLDIPVKMPR